MADLNTLIKDCQGGKRSAQRKVYELFAPKMLGICYRYTKTRSDAEDVLHDGFLKVFASVGTYTASGSFEGWIRRIMVNTALNHLKISQRTLFESDVSAYNNALAAEDDPARDLDMKEVAEAMQKLPDGFRTVLNLYAIEGYTHKEIGELLGINEITSRSQYLRAKNRLKNILTEQNKEHEQLRIRRV